jgi:hypothetical protein
VADFGDGNWESKWAFKVYLHEGPISYWAGVCLKKAEKFCSYEQANLMQNRPLKRMCKYSFTLRRLWL